MKALMVLPTLLLQKNTLYIKIERQHRNFKKEDLTSGKMGKQKNYLLKAKLSKKDFKDNAKNQSSDRRTTLFARLWKTEK